MFRFARGAGKLAALLILAFGIAAAHAAAPRSRSAIQPLSDFLASHDFSIKDGLFPIYIDQETGEAYVGIRPAQLGKEFIEVAYGESAAEAPHTPLKNRIVKFAREFNRLQVLAPNLKDYFDPADPLSRTRDPALTADVVAAVEIEAASDSLIVIPLKTFHVCDGQDIAAVHGFSENTTIVFNCGTAPRQRIEYSLIKFEDPDYKPRAFDYRVGYFAQHSTDKTSDAAAPWREFIYRWNLKKKDPAAALSEPEKPIVFWIANTAPAKFHDAMRQGVLSWNRAFEAAGFKNAIVVKDQPANPECRIGDIRCNIIDWIDNNTNWRGRTSPYTDPRTGEIVSVNIDLDYAAITRGNRRYEPLVAAAETSAAADPKTGPGFCCTPGNLPREFGFGFAALTARGAGAVDFQRFEQESVRKTVAHEVGHALGLTHNFKASTYRPFKDLQIDDTPAYPLSASIMDYFPVNLARHGQHQGAYFPTGPGPYDIWAIQYGYTPALADPAAEAKRVAALIGRSTEPALAFGHDDESDGGSIDPRDARYDLSSDPVAWAEDRLELIDESVSNLKAQFARAGQSYQALTDAYNDLLLEKQNAAVTLARYVGGIYLDQSMPGQQNARAPFRPVPLAVQKSAMASLERYVFSPQAFAIPADLASALQVQPAAIGLTPDARSGFPGTGDPQLHSAALSLQGEVLSELLSGDVFLRLTDSRLYGNAYTVTDELTDLTHAVFAADADGEINTHRQNLQATYVRMLISLAAGSHDAVAGAAVFAQLQAIEGMTAPRLFLPKSAETEAHRALIHHAIAVALKPSN